MRRPAGCRINCARPPRLTGSSSGTCSFSRLSARRARAEPAGSGRDDTPHGGSAAGYDLQELLHSNITVADAIYGLIVNGVRLCRSGRGAPGRAGTCPLFADRDTALAYRHVHATVAGSSAPGIPLACGVGVLWDGRAWTIGHVGETTIGLLGDGSAWTEIRSPCLKRWSGRAS